MQGVYFSLNSEEAIQKRENSRMAENLTISGDDDNMKKIHGPTLSVAGNRKS